MSAVSSGVSRPVQRGRGLADGFSDDLHILLSGWIIPPRTRLISVVSVPFIAAVIYSDRHGGGAAEQPART